MEPEHFRKLENMYYSAPLHEFYEGIHFAISKGRAELNLKISPKYFHAAHATHGSVYFKLLDDAAYFAVNSLIREVFVLTVSFNVHLLRPVNQGIIRSVGEVSFSSRDLYIGEATLFNQEGKKIGQGSGTFVRSKIRLDKTIGYKK